MKQENKYFKYPVLKEAIVRFIAPFIFVIIIIIYNKVLYQERKLSTEDMQPKSSSLLIQMALYSVSSIIYDQTYSTPHQHLSGAVMKRIIFQQACSSFSRKKEIVPSLDYFQVYQHHQAGYYFGEAISYLPYWKPYMC